MISQTHFRRSPQRQIPLIQPAARIFGLSQADRIRNALAAADQHRKTLLDTYANHCAALGHANGLALAYRKDAKSRAFKYINLVRAALRANARKAEALQADLLALTVPAGTI